MEMNRVSPESAGLLLTLNLYGEKCSVLSNRPGLSEQIAANFGPLLTSVEPAPAGAAADIRVLHGGARPLLRDWEEFSIQLTNAVARRFLLLHAGAVTLRDQQGRPVPPARAVAFVGSGRRGKTTCALAALHLGHQLVGDDLVALEWRTGRLFALPFPVRPRRDTRLALGRRAPTLCRRPDLTVPEQAPRLVRIIFLTGPHSARARVSHAERLLTAIHVGTSLPKAVLLERALRGVSGADFLAVTELPSIGTTLRGQVRMCQTLFRGLPLGLASEEAT